MSAKGGSIGSIVLGVVMIVVGALTIETGGVGAIIAGIGMLAGGSLGLAFQPKSTNPSAARAQDVQFATASLGMPVPVIFGEQKVTGNFMNWTGTNFHAKKVLATGGKGGGSAGQVVGYDYYLTYEYALCMGPIDEIGQVISSPGDLLVRGNKFQSDNDQINNQDIKASQAGTTVTADKSIFDSSHVGAIIQWSDGSHATITGFTNSTHVAVNVSQTVVAGSFQLFGSAEQIIYSPGDDYKELNLNGKNEGGLVRVYRGSATQTRIAASDPYFPSGMNYRNIVWALFIGYKINRGVPAPKTYQFILRRFSRCIRDDGTTVTGIETRGSADTTNPAYYQSNPAALTYEILTNQLWGRGLSSSIIHEQSFIDASEYWLSKNIGMSFTLDSPDKLISILDSIRTHLKIALVWDGDQIKMRVLTDTAQTHANILTIESTEIDSLEVMRPLWPATYNEIRLEFNNVNRNYKPDSILVPSLGNFIVTGRMNPLQIQLNAFTDWNIARKQGMRILRESSYPFMAVNFEMNRFNSQLEIGDVFRLIWDEFGETVTAYLMVTTIDSPDDKDDTIKITAIEDIWLSPVLGRETSITVPSVGAWEKVVDMLADDISLFNNPFQTTTTGIAPVTAFELPAIFTQGITARTIVLGQQPSSDVLDMQMFWSKNKTNAKYNVLGVTDSFAITGQMSTGIAHTRRTDRSNRFFDFTLTNPDLDEADLLELASLVLSPVDNLEDLIEAQTAYLIIGDEIMQVGSVQRLGFNSYRATNVVRGMFGSEINIHPVGSSFFFIADFTGSIDTKALKLPMGNILKFKTYPETASGVSETGNIFFANHFGANDQIYLGLGFLPLSPMPIGITAHASHLVTLRVRPRFYDQGAGVDPVIGDYDASKDLVDGAIQEPITDLGGMSFKVILVTDGGDTSTATGVTTTFVKEDINDINSGYVQLSNIPDQIIRGSGVHQTITPITSIRIKSFLRNQTSVDSANFVL